MLAFAATPDISAPTDTDTDNVYEVIVEADDGTNTASITVTVTVTGETLLDRYDENRDGCIQLGRSAQSGGGLLYATARLSTQPRRCEGGNWFVLRVPTRT